MNRIRTARKSAQVLALISKEKITVFLLIAIACAVVAYAVLINATILNIVKEQRLATEISNVKQHVAELEVALIEEEGTITLSYAQKQGFERIGTRHFVTRDTNLSLRNE